MTPEQPDRGLAEEDRTLSALLLALADFAGARISVGQIVAHFGRRAIGAVLFVFALIALLPLPPGSSTVLGLPLLLIAPQLALGATDPWIPRWLARRTVEASVIRAACRRTVPWVRKAERLSTRRLDFMFGAAGDLALGAVCTALAAVLVLPIPLGNLAPAATVGILALSLIQRDGLLALVGYCAAALSAGLLLLSGNLVAAAVDRLAHLPGPP